MSKGQVLSVKMFNLDPLCFAFPLAFSIRLSVAQTELARSFLLPLSALGSDKTVLSPGLASAMLKILFTALQRSTHVHSNRPQQQRQSRAAAASLLISVELQAQGCS